MEGAILLNQGLIGPRSIIVVGGSNDVTKPGGGVIQNLKNGGYRGEIYVTNPKESEVQGITCISLDGETPDIDLAIIAIAMRFVKDSIQQLISKNIKSFILFSAGFSEMGAAGKELENEIVTMIRKAYASLIGPNCIGVMTPYYSGIFAGPTPLLDRQGCDFVSGSGATAVFILEQGMLLGVPFASLFSVGNSAQIGVEELLQHWDETYDSATSAPVKLLYMENIRNPALLLKHARSLIQKGCQIAAIKAGNSDAGSRAASSHTGALASSDRAVEALFEKAGIVRCQGREDLIHTAMIMLEKRPLGRRVAIVTHAGGPGVMLTDALAAVGIQVPKLLGKDADELLAMLNPGSSVANPIDFLATGTHEQAKTILTALDEKFPEIDAICFIFGDPKLFDITPVYNVLLESMATCKKPIYPILTSVVTAREKNEYFKSRGRFFFTDEVAFARAFGRVLNTTPRLDESPLDIRVDHEAIRAVIERAEGGYLAPKDVASLLDAVAIPRVAEYICQDEKSTMVSAENCGLPIVMKVVGPVHKSDIGGVVINVDTPAKVKDTFHRLIQLPEATGVMIQPMLSGQELFVGAKREGNFGHLILCGLGGIFIEVFKDSAAALAPLVASDPGEMMQRLKSYPMLKGVRGKKGISEKLYSEIILKLSKLVETAPEIAELDINPLLGTATSITAVDARIRIDIDS